ncbi:MAG: T9SS type A sorting domain-containing protein [Bacteroidia bacterium]
MKKLIHLSLTLLVTITLKAQQPFAPPGAIWHYDFWVPATPWIGFDQITYIGDSLVMGVQCKQLQLVRYTFTSPGILVNTYVAPIVFIYQDGDTVFKLQNNDWLVWFNFAAQTGDQWIVDNTGSPFNCDSLSTLKVTSTGNSIINSQSLKRITVDTVGTSPYGYHGDILERIGPIGNNSFFPGGQCCDPTVIIEFAQYSFSCYEDSTFALYNVTPNSCGYLLNVGLNEHNQSSLVISPNPTSGSVRIVLPLFIKSAQLIIYNCMGEIVFSKKLNQFNTEIDLPLSSGVYFAEVKGNNLVHIQKLIINE